MANEEILKGKKILAVDDEEDMLEVIRDQLEAARLITAGDFRTAAELLETQRFDLAILDIMGVKGFDLLELCDKRQIPAVMLTAHAMNPESLQKSIDTGAVSFLPKDELPHLTELVIEILQDLEQRRTHWGRLKKRLGPAFKELWGEMWEEIQFPQDPGLRW